MPSWELLAGPAALAVAASALVVVLLRQHFKRDELDAAILVSLTKAVGEFPGALKDLTAELAIAAQRERSRRRGESPDDV